jgi:CO/xanthine dehydrogenase Mo-binding subunit
MDPVEIRLKNMVQPDQFPLKTSITGQDFVENVLDSGNYPATLLKAREMIEYDKFKKEIQPKLRREGKHVGMGIVCFVEGTGVGPYEGARVAVDSGGKVSVATGISTQGQGHFTVFAQIAAEQLGVDIKDVRVVTGDTGIFHWGAGTFASRGAVVAGSAVNKAALLVREKILELAGRLFQVPEDKLVLEDGMVKAIDDPSNCMTLGELSAKSAPTRGITPADFEPGLEATAYFGPPYGATGQGAEAMVVEVDPETLEIKIQRLVLVHDCGNVINPMILEGQVQGGLQMGIGNSYFEQMIYDENGQLMNASFMDYLMPQSTDMPAKMDIGHISTPSPLNPLGMKGVGEAGAIPTPSCFVQTVEDAFPELKLHILDVPLSPSRMFEIVQESKK